MNQKSLKIPLISNTLNPKYSLIPNTPNPNTP